MTSAAPIPLQAIPPLAAEYKALLPTGQGSFGDGASLGDLLPAAFGVTWQGSIERGLLEEVGQLFQLLASAELDGIPEDELKQLFLRWERRIETALRVSSRMDAAARALKLEVEERSAEKPPSKRVDQRIERSGDRVRKRGGARD